MAVNLPTKGWIPPPASFRVKVTTYSIINSSNFMIETSKNSDSYPTTNFLPRNTIFSSSNHFQNCWQKRKVFLILQFKTLKMYDLSKQQTHEFLCKRVEGSLSVYFRAAANWTIIITTQPTRQGWKVNKTEILLIN